MCAGARTCVRMRWAALYLWRFCRFHPVCFWGFCAMDLHKILPRDLVNTHIVFKTPSGELQSGVRGGSAQTVGGSPHPCREPF